MALKVWEALWRIRVRLFVGFLVCFMGVSIFVALSYRYFLMLEENLHVLNISNDLLNSILEVKRYEKNYFLFRQERDLQEALGYLNRFEHILTEQKEEIRRVFGQWRWERMRDLSWQYRRSLSVVHDAQVSHGPSDDDLRRLVSDSMSLIRSAGKELISLAEEMSRAEQIEIRSHLGQYRILFGVFFLTTILMGALVVFLLEKKFIRPLQVIEEATRSVARGEFIPIPGIKTRDEIGSLVGAFNQMVEKLQESREQMIRTEKLSALGALTSGVAHELNNPLGNISTSSQILMEEVGEDLDPYHRGLLESIEDQVIKARDIVRALLEFSREREFELKDVHLSRVVEDTLMLVRGEIPSNVEVVVDVPEGLVLKLDKARMERALLNVILNGIQAMEGGGILTIRAKVEGEGEYVLIEISDTGRGIPRDVMPRIFDPFFTTKPVGQGTGMGLAIVYGIIENHGGEIAVESEERRGTTVRIRLPMGHKQGR
jgi:signal transduction histidine kinase